MSTHALPAHVGGRAAGAVEADGGLPAFALLTCGGGGGRSAGCLCPGSAGQGGSSGGSACDRHAEYLQRPAPAAQARIR
eukprot:scaffold12920_cov22-Tisochrysis_lutea.AAC.2